jgi:2-keto-myo-inositol isomerase
MQRGHYTRRQMLALGGAVIGSYIASHETGAVSVAAQTNSKQTAEFSYCFNTSTISGQKLPLEKEIEIIAQAGYNSIEPWVREINQYLSSGGSTSDLRKRITDLGLTVESAVTFYRWIVDDDTERAKGLEQAKRDMDILAQIGGKRIAAPPEGATRGAQIDLVKAAERYRALLAVGDEMGIVPQIELWGHSVNLHLLGQSMFVVIESGHPKACLLPDVFHIYKGGSDFNGLKQISANAIQVFHLNDYPSQPPREKISDSDRLYPGEGIAPLTQILGDLHAKGGGTVLSLELFNPIYYKQVPLEVAKTGIAKMKSAVSRALVSDQTNYLKNSCVC